MPEITALQAPPSLSRSKESTRAPVRAALVQHRWHPEPAVLRRELDEGIGRAADHGAGVVFLPELTPSRYPSDAPPGPGASTTGASGTGGTPAGPAQSAEYLLTGPASASPPRPLHDTRCSCMPPCMGARTDRMGRG